MGSAEALGVSDSQKWVDLIAVTGALASFASSWCMAPGCVAASANVDEIPNG
jgi:hypothetical protein